MALMFGTSALWAHSAPSREALQHRLTPVGKNRIEAPQQNLADIPRRTGQSIYEQHCSLCHRDGVAGAPKFQDKTSWAAHLTDGGLDALVVSAIKGKNAMPPKGTCQECNESDIKAAIDYMVPKQ